MKNQSPKMNVRTTLFSKTALVVALGATGLFAPLGAQAQSPDSGLMNLFNNLDAPEEQAPVTTTDTPLLRQKLRLRQKLNKETAQPHPHLTA